MAARISCITGVSIDAIGVSQQLRHADSATTSELIEWLDVEMTNLSRVLAAARFRLAEIRAKRLKTR